MPAERSPHACTLMAFPSIASAEDQLHLERLQSEVTSLANIISRFEPVQLYARTELVNSARERVGPTVTVKSATVDQLWIRDSGPTFVQDAVTGRLAAVDWNFSYWGGKLPPTGDQGLAGDISAQNNATAIHTALVAEGGALECDGDGTFLGAESCLLNDNRNPGVTKADIEAELHRLLGVSGFVWVKGLKGYEGTDYHVDALVRFAMPGVVILSKPAANAPKATVAVYEQAHHALTSSTDARGRRLKVYDCEEPNLDILRRPGDEDVVASYANYYFVNGGVIMPKFGDDRADERAVELFQELFPTRQVVQVSLNALPRTGGGIHCATQQVPLLADAIAP